MQRGQTIIPVNGQKCMIRWRERKPKSRMRYTMLYSYNEVAVKYGKEFAMRADSFAVDMSKYTENLSYQYIYARTPEEFIEIFSKYGSYVYSREEYLWKLAYLLSVKYYFKKGGRYDPEIQKDVDAWKIASTIDEDMYIDNYLHLSKIQEGESINRFFELDEKLVAISIKSISNKFLKHLSTEKLYSVAEEIFLLYVAEEDANPTHDEWEYFIKRLRFSHQKENFNLSTMIGAIALCTEYSPYEAYLTAHKTDVLARYKQLKSSTRRDRRSTNLFVVIDSNFGEPPYRVWWRSAR